LLTKAVRCGPTAASQPPNEWHPPVAVMLSLTPSVSVKHLASYHCVAQQPERGARLI